MEGKKYSNQELAQAYFDICMKYTDDIGTLLATRDKIARCETDLQEYRTKYLSDPKPGRRGTTLWFGKIDISYKSRRVLELVLLYGPEKAKEIVHGAEDNKLRSDSWTSWNISYRMRPKRDFIGNRTDVSMKRHRIEDAY